MSDTLRPLSELRESAAPNDLAALFDDEHLDARTQEAIEDLKGDPDALKEYLNFKDLPPKVKDELVFDFDEGKVELSEAQITALNFVRRNVARDLTELMEAKYSTEVREAKTSPRRRRRVGGVIGSVVIVGLVVAGVAVAKGGRGGQPSSGLSPQAAAVAEVLPWDGDEDGTSGVELDEDGNPYLADPDDFEFVEDLGYGVPEPLRPWDPTGRYPESGTALDGDERITDSNSGNGEVDVDREFVTPPENAEQLPELTGSSQEVAQAFFTRLAYGYVNPGEMESVMGDVVTGQQEALDQILSFVQADYVQELQRGLRDGSISDLSINVDGSTIEARGIDSAGNRVAISGPLGSSGFEVASMTGEVVIDPLDQNGNPLSAEEQRTDFSLNVYIADDSILVQDATFSPS